MAKQKLIIMIVAAILAVTIPVGLIVALGGNNGNNNNGQVLTPAEEYTKLESDALHKLVNSMAETPNTSGSASTATIDIIPSDILFTMLGLGEMDMSWAEKLSFTMENKVKGSLIESLTHIGLNGKDIAALNLISNSQTGVNFLMIPTICTQYLQINQNSMTGDAAGGGATSMSGLLSQLNAPEMDALKALLNKYIDIALSNMTLVEKTTKNVTVSGKTQSVTVYTNYITEKVALDTVKAILNEVKKDQAIKDILPEGTDLEATIDEWLSSMNTEPSEDKNEAIVLTAYVDTNGKIIGRALHIDREFALSCITLSDESGSVSEFSLAGEDAQYTLAGNQNSAGGTYTLSTTSGGQTLVLGTLTYTVSGNSGICELKLSDFIEQNFLGTTELDPSLRIKWKLADNGNAADIDLYLYMASQQLIGIETSFSTLPGDVEITVPDSGIDINDADRMEYYLSQVQFATLEQNMRAAGIPDAIVDALMAQLSGDAGE